MGPYMITWHKLTIRSLFPIALLLFSERGGCLNFDIAIFGSPCSYGVAAGNQAGFYERVGLAGIDPYGLAASSCFWGISTRKGAGWIVLWRILANYFKSHWDYNSDQ